MQAQARTERKMMLMTRRITQRKIQVRGDRKTLVIALEDDSLRFK